MSSGKYGRLYTQADIEELFTRLALGEGPQESLQCMEEHRLLTFPADEPVFLLRGNDLLAARTIEEYWAACVEAETDRKHTDAVKEAVKQFAGWRAEHPDRVKVPD